MGFDCAAEVVFSCLSCVRGGADRRNRGISPAVWREKDLTTSPGWTCSNANGAVVPLLGRLMESSRRLKGCRRSRWRTFCLVAGKLVAREAMLCSGLVLNVNSWLRWLV